MPFVLLLNVNLFSFVKVEGRCKNMLLEMATPDAIARLPASGLKGQASKLWKTYFHEQQHSSLAAFMRHVLTLDNFHIDKQRQEGLLIQVRLIRWLLIWR